MGDGRTARRDLSDRRRGHVMPADGARQTADLEVRLGKRAGFALRVSVTPGGLLAIGGLVSAILLSTAAIVRTAGLTDAPARLPR